MKPIKVPKVPATAFDSTRPASDLLQRQVDQLQHVLGAKPGSGDRMSDMKAAAKRVKTEGQASAFMLKAMMALHPEGSTRPLAKPLKRTQAIRVKSPATKSPATTSSSKTIATTSSRKAPAKKR